jgi:hypothetical protein
MIDKLIATRILTRKSKQAPLNTLRNVFRKVRLPSPTSPQYWSHVSPTSILLAFSVETNLEKSHA